MVNFMLCLFYNNKINKVAGGFKDVKSTTVELALGTVWCRSRERSAEVGRTGHPPREGCSGPRCPSVPAPACAFQLDSLWSPCMVSGCCSNVAALSGEPSLWSPVLKVGPASSQMKVKENKIYFQGEAKTMFAVTSGIKWWCGPPTVEKYFHLISSINNGGQPVKINVSTASELSYLRGLWSLASWLLALKNVFTPYFPLMGLQEGN